MNAVVAVLVIGFVYPSEKFDPPPLRYTGNDALGNCLRAAEAFLRGAERQMLSKSSATASCRIER